MHTYTNHRSSPFMSAPANPNHQAVEFTAWKTPLSGYFPTSVDSPTTMLEAKRNLKALFDGYDSAIFTWVRQRSCVWLSVVCIDVAVDMQRVATPSDLDVTDQYRPLDRTRFSSHPTNTNKHTGASERRASLVSGPDPHVLHLAHRRRPDHAAAHQGMYVSIEVG